LYATCMSMASASGGFKPQAMAETEPLDISG
jgi:hypothetical protein